MIDAMDFIVEEDATGVTPAGELTGWETLRFEVSDAEESGD
jgi:hypothetical protein